LLVFFLIQISRVFAGDDHELVDCLIMQAMLKCANINC